MPSSALEMRALLDKIHSSSVERSSTRVTSQMLSVRQSMLFLVGPPRNDPTGPRASAENSGFSCPEGIRNDTARCDGHKWHVEMHAWVRHVLVILLCMFYMSPSVYGGKEQFLKIGPRGGVWYGMVYFALHLH